MAPIRRSTPKSKRFTRAKVSSKLGSQSVKKPTPPAQNVGTQDAEVHINTPSSAHNDNGREMVSRQLSGAACDFIFRSGTLDLAEIIEADQRSGLVTPESLLSKLEDCSKGLQTLLNRRNSAISAVARHVDPDDQHDREEIVQYFEQHWTNRIMEYITHQAVELDVRLRADDVSIKDEWEFAKLGRQILYGSGTTPLHDLDIDYAEWCRFSPKCVDHDIQELLLRLDDTYHSFQKHVYLQENTPEEFKLWYLIWANLKKTFVLFNQHESSFPSDVYGIEEELFTQPEGRKLFEWIINSMDYFGPQQIEDLMGRYVDLVHHRVGQSLNISMPISNISFQSLTAFPDELEWNHEALNALHSAVLRLNYLTKGPSVLRRLGRKFSFFLSDADVAERPDLVVSESPTWFPIPAKTGAKLLQTRTFDTSRLNTRYWLEDVPPGASRLDQLNEAVNASSTGEEISDYGSLQDQSLAELNQEDLTGEDSDEIEYQDLSTDHAGKNSRLQAFMNYTPRGRNIISSYDYVHCPVPENRSYEVANSRLINRDLKTPGIISDGLRTRDLVNLPPPHCQAPGTWTLWKRRIPLGPFEVFGLLANAVTDRVLGRTRAPVTRPLVPPQVTPREACRTRKHKNKLAAKHDSSTRVTKPSFLQRASLRGGGSQHTPRADKEPRHPPELSQNPRHAPLPDETPSRRQKRATNSIPPHPAPPLAGQSSRWHNSDGENENPFRARPIGEGAPLDRPLGMHDDRPPLNVINIFEDETAEEQVDETNSHNPGPPDEQAGHSKGEGVATGSGGGPSGDPSIPADGDLNCCHRCPIYPDQYHHLCSGDCVGRHIKIENRELLNSEFFKGSLWEMVEEKYFRCGDVETMTEFIDQYHWGTARDGVARTFFLSHGAMIIVSRQETRMIYQIVGGGKPYHRATYDSLNEIEPELVLLRLPERLTRVSEWEAVDDESGRWKPIDPLPGFDEMVNPDQPTEQQFKIFYQSRPSSDEPEVVVVQLERFRSFPWEALIIAKESTIDKQTQARDYEATRRENALEDARKDDPGHKKTTDFQSKLKENQEANKIRQQDAQRQTTAAAAGGNYKVAGAAPVTPAGLNTAEGTPAEKTPAEETPVEGVPKVSNPQPTIQSQLPDPVAAAGQSADKAAKESGKDAEENIQDGNNENNNDNNDDTGKDKTTEITEEKPAEAPAQTRRSTRATTKEATKNAAENVAKRAAVAAARKAAKYAKGDVAKPRAGPKRPAQRDSDDDDDSSQKGKKKPSPPSKRAKPTPKGKGRKK